MKKLTMVFMVSMFVWLTTATHCPPRSTPNPNRGFDVRVVTTSGIQTVADVQGSLIGGNPTTGTVSQFPRMSIFGVGFTQIPGARVPGTWRLTYGAGFTPSLCLGILTVDRNVSSGSQETLFCQPRFFSFTASPDVVNAVSPPATIDVTGNGSDTLYGTPMIAFYDEFGNVVASGPANQLLYNNGVVSGVRVNVSDLSQAYDGTYTGLVHNVQADGTWEVIGAAAITVYGNPPPPDDGGGGGGGCGPQPLGSLRPACDY